MDDPRLVSPVEVSVGFPEDASSLVDPPVGASVLVSELLVVGLCPDVVRLVSPEDDIGLVSFVGHSEDVLSLVVPVDTSALVSELILVVALCSDVLSIDVGSRVELSTVELLWVSVIVSAFVLSLIEEVVSSIDVELSSVVEDDKIDEDTGNEESFLKSAEKEEK